MKVSFNPLDEDERAEVRILLDYLDGNKFGAYRGPSIEEVLTEVRNKVVQDNYDLLREAVSRVDEFTLNDLAVEGWTRSHVLASWRNLGRTLKHMNVELFDVRSNGLVNVYRLKPHFRALPKDY